VRNGCALIVGQTTGNHAEESGRLVILVMFAEDVTANEPPYGTAHENVGRKVLFSKDACEAQTGGEAVGSDLGHRSVIFGCYDGCGRPGDHAMSRGEGRIEAYASLKELTLRAVQGGSLAHCDCLHYLIDNEAVYHGFTPKDSGLCGVVVVVDVTEAVDNHGGSNKPTEKTIGGGCGVAVERCVIESGRRHDLVVGCDGNSSGKNKRNEESKVVFADPGGAGPNGRLVFENVDRGLAKCHRVLVVETGSSRVGRLGSRCIRQGVGVVPGRLGRVRTRGFLGNACVAEDYDQSERQNSSSAAPFNLR
jgi:hypothetical protein